MEEDEDFMASLEATMKWRKRVDEENKLNHAELKRRCNAANISCVEDFDEDRQERYFTLSLPGEQRLYVLADDVKSLHSIPFEKYTFLSGYTANWSFEYKVIEAAIEEVIDEAAIITASFYSFSLEEKRDYLIRRLRGKKSNDFMLSNEDKSISIKFDLGSAAFKELTNRNTITITISCLKVSQYEEAIDCLEKFSNALFFEIELSHGLQLNLVRERPTSKRGRAGLDRDKQTDLQFQGAYF